MTTSWDTSAMTALRDRAAGLTSRMVELQRRLHRCPEIGLVLPQSSQAVLDAIAELPVSVRTGNRTSSVTAVLEGTRPGPTVFLRSDLDALPLTEAADHPTRSLVEGAMHACGHDHHAAMLVGAAHLLAEFDLPGRVVLLWQPGEEGHDGMAVMLEEGLGDLVAEAGDDAASFGLHLLSGTLPSGVFAGRSGASHAATGSFTVTLRGPGGHGAFPHQCPDPVPAAAELISTWQVQIARTMDAFDPGILTVGSVHGGTAGNAIADSIVLEGTTRAFSDVQQMRIRRLVEETSRAIAAIHRLEVVVDYRPGYPAVVNDPTETNRFLEVVGCLLGPERCQRLPTPLPAGDDYSRLLSLVPGAFLMLGAGVPDAGGTVHPNHSPHVAFDDAVLADGAAALAAVTLARLHHTSSGGSS